MRPPGNENVKESDSVFVARFGRWLASQGKNRHWAEIGCHVGYTSVLLAPWCQQLDVFDFEDRVEQTLERCRVHRHMHVHGFPNTYKTYDSYNWGLAKRLAEGVRYDFVFLDGAHDLARDGLATLLAVRMLRPGGFLWLDDCDWSIDTSPSMGGTEWAEESYTLEQRQTRQMNWICDLLLAPDETLKEFQTTHPRVRVFMKKESDDSEGTSRLTGEERVQTPR